MLDSGDAEKMRLHILKLIGITGLVAMALGCASAEQRRQQMENKCSSYGFPRGSVDFSRCLMQLDANQQASDAQSSQQLLQQSQRLLNPNYGKTFCYPQPNGVGTYCVQQ